MNRETKVTLSFVALCVAFSVVAMALGWCASRPAPQVQAPAATPPTLPPGVTVHPQGELAPMPLDAVSPPFTVDYGDGRGPQVQRGALRFGDAQTSAGVEAK